MVFGYARSQKKLEGSVDAGRNARAGTPAEAAHDLDTPLLAAYCPN